MRSTFHTTRSSPKKTNILAEELPEEQSGLFHSLLVIISVQLSSPQGSNDRMDAMEETLLFFDVLNCARYTVRSRGMTVS
jgi:hypothetical protein